MAGHAQLKFVMMECWKTQIRLMGLICWWICMLLTSHDVYMYSLLVYPITWFICIYVYDAVNLGSYVNYEVLMWKRLKIMTSSLLFVSHPSKFINIPEAHWPQRSSECTTMKAIWLLRRRFLNVFFFFENLAFRLPWSPIKISDLGKIHMVGTGQLQKHFSKTFVKIPAVTQK